MLNDLIGNQFTLGARELIANEAVDANASGGSPAAVLNAAETAIKQTGVRWKAKTVHLALVERKASRYRILCDTLPRPDTLPGITVHTYRSEFTKALGLIKQAVPEPFVSNNPLFAFIDPFGATGAPFDAVAALLNSPCSEVLINLDADGLSRIYMAKSKVNHAKLLSRVFGDTTWQDRLLDGQSQDEQCRIILQLYKEKLRQIPGVKYIFQTEMRGVAGTLNYYLVFASKHPLGLEKMKQAMRKMAQNGTYKFADAHVGQASLFHFDAPKEYYMNLYNQFKGRRVDYDGRNDDLTAYALNETPLDNAKSMLNLLEKQGLISLTAPRSRKRGTFNETVTAIEFREEAFNGQLF